MVRFTVLASGSKGNSTVVSGGRTRILVDAGLSCRELFRRMKLAGEDPATLDAIIITHEHQDHVNGLAVTARKLGIPVYFTEATHRAWMRWLTPRRQMTYAQWLEQCRKQAAERAGRAAERGAGMRCQPRMILRKSRPKLNRRQTRIRPQTRRSRRPARHPVKEDPTWLPSVEYFQAGQPFRIGDIAISPFTIPHDAADPVGFVFRSEGVRMGFATDLGYIPPNVKAQLQGVDCCCLSRTTTWRCCATAPIPGRSNRGYFRALVTSPMTRRPSSSRQDTTARPLT